MPRNHGLLHTQMIHQRNDIRAQTLQRQCLSVRPGASCAVAVERNAPEVTQLGNDAHVEVL